jgi:nicotinamidase-related amidase
MNAKSKGIWDAADSALLLIDYQDHMLDLIFEQDRRVIELNVRSLAQIATGLNIPIILSTVGVEMGVNGPTVSSLRSVIPDVKEIDRSTMNAWDDKNFVAAVKATGRKRLVMGGIATSVCLAYPVIEAMKEGYEVTFIVDAVGDVYKEAHDIAVLRLIQAGAVPNTTVGMIAEWFRGEWKSPLAEPWKNLAVSYYDELAELKKAPKFAEPTGLTTYRKAWNAEAAAQNA